MSAPGKDVLERLGASLREIDPGSLQADADGSEVHWFLGEDGTELFAWRHPGKPTHHVQLVFARVSVEWDTQKGLATGKFPSTSAIAGGRYDAYVLTLASTVDVEVCRAALTLLARSTVDREFSGPLRAALEAAVETLPG